MKRIFLILIIVFVCMQTHAQFVYKLKADSVLITNDSCTAELNLENSTKNIKGFLYNKGNGRTEFRKVVKLNDSTFIFGGDTLVIGGSAAWSLKGNSGTNPATNFIGTTDSQAVVMRTKNIERFRVTPQGFVGINTNNPASWLHIMDTTGSVNPQLTITANGNGFTRYQFTNTSAGGGAAAGALYTNNINESMQLYMGGSNNGYTPSRALLRSNGANGFKISSDKGVIQFQIGTVVPAGLADTGNVKMVIDSFGVRLKKADLVTFDTVNYQPMVIEKISGRILKTNGNLVSGIAWSLTGNVGTNPTANFIGTTDSQALVIRTNNIQRMYFGTNGKVGINAIPTKANLHLNVDGGTITPALIPGSNIAGMLISTDHTLAGCCSSEYAILTAGNSSNLGRFVGAKTRGTFTSPLPVQNGDPVTQFAGSAYDGTSMIRRASIDMMVDGTVSAGTVPMNIRLSTGAGSLIERMRIASSGNIGIGTTSPAYTLDVNGKLGVHTIDSTSSAANMLYQDAATGEIKKAPLQPYKKYVALLSQSGDNNPTVIVLENTLGGTITWARNNTGLYIGTLPGAFTQNKTWFNSEASDQAGNVVATRLLWGNANSVTLVVKDGTLNNMDGWTDLSIEIRVYP